MNWKLALVAILVAPAVVMQAADQAPAQAKQAAPAARAAAAPAKPMTQPKVEARKAQVITVAGLKFRDLNKNGTLDRYEDWRLPADQRVADLVAKMTAEETTGLMIHSSLSGFTGPNGEVLGLPAAGGRGGAGRGGAATRDRVFEGGANPKTSSRWAVQPHAAHHGAPHPLHPGPPERGRVARHHGEIPQRLQEMAEASRPGIRRVCTDPRHGVGRGGPGGAVSARPRRLRGRRSHSGPISSGSPSHVIRNRCGRLDGSRPKSCGPSVSSASSGRWPT
jgi:hypothetical protein